MDNGDHSRNPTRFIVLTFTVFLTIAAFVGLQPFQASGGSPSVATYSPGLLHLTISYNAVRAGAGQLVIEVLDPEDKVLGRAERHIEVVAGEGQWRSEIKLDKALPLDELVWHRVRYRFEYGDGKGETLEGTESVSQIIRTPVLHIIGQGSYLSGGQAAVRLIVTDSTNEVISGRGSVRVELIVADQKPQLLFSGQLNRRGTTEAQFRFPAGLVGSYQLHYIADTSIGSTEFTQDVRLEDKVSILLTTEKPIYQPGQTIHVRALALDRSDHEAVSNRKLIFELEDSRGNKVFKKATDTDAFGVASADFGLADEVNLGTYHLRALMGDPDAPTNTAELALNVERYVLPKFKVAVEFSENGKKTKRGYQPGDHVIGTVRANYFFGKPVDEAEINVKASAIDVAVFEVAAAKGKTTADGSYHLDIQLPKYFAGRPLNHGVARVLIEATVKDSAGHSETRGEPITVSEAPLLITAVPEGGTLVPNLENRVFVLTSYPDGTPAKADLVVHATGNGDQRLPTDDGGIAIARVKARAGRETLEIEATDQEGNHASSKLELQTREDDDQILLRTERSVYSSGDRIQLKVFSTKTRGAAYVDIVREGHTVLTRDLELENGQAELSLTATPEMAGTVVFNAYLFGRDARPVGDHRLIFVQPADDLKIETAGDAPVYRPGGEARISFRVTNSHGQGVHAALGLQVVDEAVFALAEKQPGFAKVFFYLEQEVMKPRYEIHSIGMPEVVEPVEKSRVEQRDRAAQALFAATEVVNSNKFETQFGGDIPMAKYGEYTQRYAARFQKQANQLAMILSAAYRENPKLGDPTRVFTKFAQAHEVEFRDAWGTPFTLEPMRWDSTKSYYLLRSAGPDRQLNTADDLQAYLLFHRRTLLVSPGAERPVIQVNIEHGRGALNGMAEIAGTVTDSTGAVVPGASIEVREISTAKPRTTTTNDAGQFHLAGLAPGVFVVQVSMAGFRVAHQGLTLEARDRAVLSAVLEVGQATETVEVTGASPMLQTAESTLLAAPVPPGLPGGSAGGVMGGAIDAGRLQELPLNGRNFTQFAVLNKKTRAVSGVPKDDSGSPGAHVRSYFPEALYINPEIITDKDGHASIVIPMADSITTWQMAMIASTQHGALGTSTSSLKVFQDFFVDLDLPVTLTQGDRVSIPVAIYNYSGSAGDVDLRLEEDKWFSLVDDIGEKSVTVESTRVGGSQFTLEAKRIGKFKLTLSGRMKGGVDRADVVVREVEVIPNGREQNLVFNGRLENAVQQKIDFPPNAVPEASKIFVRLYPGPLSQVIEGMDGILRMPSGCFEQTSSSTYPNVLALDYMKRTKKLTPEVHAKAEGYIANGYQRLLTFEVPGGGFSWFGNAPANKILTAYGLMEFSDMSKVYDVDPKLISRTQQWLAGQQQTDGSWKPDASFINEGATNRYNSDVLRITAYIAWALENTGFHGPTVERAQQFVEKHMSAKIDAYTLAVLANFAADLKNGDHEKDRDFTRQAIQLLLDARTEKDDQVWWNADETGVYSTGASASAETTGLAAQVLLKSGEASAVARKAMTYIASKKDSTGTWGTTQATIMALRALLLATEKGAADVHGTLEVLLNGKPVEKLALTSENNDLLHQFVFKNIDSQSSSHVQIQFEGKGGLAYQVVGTYFLPWDQKPASEPLSIEVAYDRTQLAQDDIASATATIKNNLDKAANMVMVDLGIPPGFDLLSEDLQDYQEKSARLKSGHLSKFSLTATQAILYFDSFAPGDSAKIKFRLRAKYPIRAQTFQSRVYEYYDPEVSSLARPVMLEVHKR
jgi:A-macroglobulin TED domain/Alpha-2-macroglobulin family/Carboxypeptidase regulatory-like domain/A-macroglobulin receptor binding domain/MG2 domain/Alpha-2-macroglobulin bait region domain